MQACFLQGISQLTVLRISNNRALTFLWKQFNVVRHLSEPFSVLVHFTGLAVCRFLTALDSDFFLLFSRGKSRSGGHLFQFRLAYTPDFPRLPPRESKSSGRVVVKRSLGAQLEFGSE